jgi:hypothetical protein
MSRSYPSSANSRLEKSARLAVLLELDRDGSLAGRSNQEIADLFDHGLHRSTILRDLRQLAKLKREVSRLRLQLNPKRLKK